MNSIMYFNRCARNPVSFYLSNLPKDKLDNKSIQIDYAKRLHELACAGNSIERRRVAEHPATSVETLLDLSQDTDADIRLAAAEHPKMPYFVLKQLAQDPCLDVRLGLAENSNLPISILEMLVQDENPYIEDKARRTIDRLNANFKKPILCLA